MVQKSGVHQLRLVVYPIIFQVFLHPRWCRISSSNSMKGYLDIGEDNPSVASGSLFDSGNVCPLDFDLLVRCLTTTAKYLPTFVFHADLKW